MSDPKPIATIDSIAWGKVFHFHKMVTAAVSAMQPQRLIIGLLLVASIMFCGSIWDLIWPSTVSPAGLNAGAATVADIESYQNAAERFDQMQDRDGVQLTEALGRLELMRPKGSFEASQTFIVEQFQSLVQTTRSLNFVGMGSALVDMIYGLPTKLWMAGQYWFTVLFGIIFFILISLGGGALSRTAACQLAGVTTPSVLRSFAFSIAFVGRLFSALVGPLALALIFCFLISLIGLLFLVPVLDVIGGIVFGVSLVLSFLATWCLLGYLFGFPLLIPAVTCEAADGFDAMQRAYSYIASRPIHMLCYYAVGLIGLLVGFIAVGLIATFMVNIAVSWSSLGGSFYGTADAPVAFSIFSDSWSLYQLGVGQEAVLEANLFSEWTASALSFWIKLVLWLVSAWAFSFFFSASTTMYLLMRRASDGQDFSAIWQPGMVPGTYATLTSEQIPAEEKTTTEV
ncbi:MAG: hypothetical protein P8J86_06570 [Phycisphaerales bacterium]|nr:hypothetical protein [Phycisphaerales bacterium]